MADTFLYIYI